MNSKGQILTWQLTSGTSFSQTECLLHDLCCRAERQENPIRTVYIDDCCKLRTKVQNVFGKEVLVKLDVFHAVQRITRTLPKRHPLLHHCTERLRLVFRKDGDCVSNRMSHTPSADIILKQLEKFVDEWRDAKDNSGAPIFRQDTFHAISNLKRHITAGCLSHIPPGSGTNRNEKFHSHINSFFNKSRIGVLLAYALLTVIMHSHNTAIRTRGKCVVRPISASPFQGTPSTDCQSIGIMPKLRYQQEKMDGNEQWEINLSECEIDLHQVVSLYTTALRKLQIARSLSHMQLEKLQSLVSTFKEFQVLPRIPQSEAQYKDRLNGSGLILTPAPRDGNWFFTSVALSLVSQEAKWSDTLTRISILPQMRSNVANVANVLRKLFVQELLQQQEAYESFVEEGVVYLQEAKKFLQDGFYDNMLGDTMPLAMATVLQATIIIFPSSSESSTMYITPQRITTDETIFVCYDPTGSGHYDAALPYQDSEQVAQHTPVDSSTHIRCRCGVNNTSEQSACVPLPHYSTRCISATMHQSHAHPFAAARTAATHRVLNLQKMQERESEDILMH